MARLLNRTTLSTVAGALALAALSGAAPAQAGDLAAGKQVFAAQCSSCHTATKGGPTLLGPNLYGVVGRPVATMKGFFYSPAMKAYGGAWTETRLRGYLPAPQKTIPGIKMTYPGLHDPHQLDDLLAFLGSLK
jgi:cytochrome c